MVNTIITVRVVDAYVFKKVKKKIHFLLLKRAGTKNYEHLWQGVAGKLEKGESAWQAALRELDEETSLKPKCMFIADHVSKFYERIGDRINLIPVFGIEVGSEEVRLSDEHTEFRWMNVDEAEETLRGLLADSDPKATKPPLTGQEKRLLVFRTAPTLPGP